ncbi:MAG: bifunctional glutamate N-acetyltransferase/amino-acid acetyltransferase ArgJ [Desulfobacterales bacterium]|nr:bifunctional glutamate N-acetyltransferase/amino-acid acetyltransferase ArgJ [Desulfobacterales bacterium]
MNNQIICPGFKASGIAAGIKKNGKKDLGLIFSEVPATAAGLFTTNKVKAAPVILDMERMKSGRCQAIIANSGNANCYSGPQGMDDAKEMTALVAQALGISEALVQVSSTGVIGAPMPMEKVRTAVPDLVKALCPEGIDDLGVSILTTDLVKKVICRQGEINGKTFTIAAVAKGSGMIRPDMATMLCFVVSDVNASPEVLKACLVEANEGSFNRITVDGDTSTNDTVLIMANGLSDISIEDAAERGIFQEILNDVLLCLAKAIVEDGEGATKLVEIIVKGAESNEDARTIADTIAHSSLVKTAFFGEDANWGRILAAAGRAGVPLNPDMVDILFGKVMLVKNGVWLGVDVETEATKVLKNKSFSVTVDLKMARGMASVLTCDFSIDYVKINADYRS